MGLKDCIKKYVTKLIYFCFRSESISSLGESIGKLMGNRSQRNLCINSKLFIKRSTNEFRNLLQIGCFLRFVPYQWNKQMKNLEPASGKNLTFFKFQKNLHLVYTSFMWVQFLHRIFLREFSFIGALWCLALSSACLSYITMSMYADELMQFSNQLLNKKTT